MAKHYTRYLEILKKWPVEEERTTHCFGRYLRDSTSKWFTLDGRVIGHSEECERRLVSLERILNNHYKQKYPARVESVTGMNVQECRKALTESYGEDQGIWKKIISKVTPKPPEN